MRILEALLLIGFSLPLIMLRGYIPQPIVKDLLLVTMISSSVGLISSLVYAEVISEFDKMAGTRTLLRLYLVISFRAACLLVFVCLIAIGVLMFIGYR